MYTFIVCNVSYLLTRAKYIPLNLAEQLKMYAMYAMFTPVFNWCVVRIYIMLNLYYILH